MGTYIHPTAIIGSNVQIGNDVYIGAYSIIGDVPEYPGKITHANFQNEHPTIIGDGVTIREHVTIHAGVKYSTHIMRDVYIMSHCHIGHDVIVMPDAVLHTGAIIGGFTFIGRYARIGLNASTHPHTTIAKGVMIGAQSFVKGNTIEFSTYVGCPAKYIGENHRLLERLNGIDN